MSCIGGVGTLDKANKFHHTSGDHQRLISFNLIKRAPVGSGVEGCIVRVLQGEGLRVLEQVGEPGLGDHPEGEVGKST